MTTLTDTQVITASGGLVELGYSQITSNVTVTSAVSTGDSVIPPLTVVCDGGPILVEFFCSAARPHNALSANLAISLYYDGAEKHRYWGSSTNTATGYPDQPVHLQYRMTPTAGSHTFSVRAGVSTGTGVIYADSATSGAAPAFLRVSKIVQATQWPAVTTGTIICTSSTRPGSPFEGQKIWETDTSKEYTYTGSAWIQTGPPPRRLAIQTTTSSVSTGATVGATEVFSDLTFTAAGNTEYLVHAYIPYVETGTAANSYIEVHITNGSTTSLSGWIGLVGKATGTYSVYGTINALWRYTPSAGTVTLNVSGKHVTSAGGIGGLSGAAPAFLAVYGPELT